MSRNSVDEPDRRQLRQIIAGLTDGLMLIEPDRRIVWANDAALRMHSVTDLAELGRTVDDYNERFILRTRDGKSLSVRSRPVERLCRGEDFTDVIVHVARRQEEQPDFYHCVRGFTLTDDEGQPDCLVLVICDVTEAFEAQERFERMFSANPAPAVIVRVGDLRYVRANQGFLEMTGHTVEGVVGRTIYDVDILAGAERREIAKSQLSSWKAVPQMEAELALPDGTTKLVIVAGHPVEFGVERCMIFTFADLEPRRRLESALRQSEERFAKAFRLAPVPMALATLDGHRFLSVNNAFLELTGWAVEEVVGRRPGEIELWESSAVRREVERRITEGGGFRGYELKLKTRSQALVDCLMSAETATIRGEACVLSVFQDITERKRTELELIAAIEATMKDTAWLSGKIMDKLAALRAPQSGGSASPDVELTRRELEVLSHIAQGRADAGIAEALGLSRNTVRNHVARLYGKIGAHNRAEAIIWARERGR